MAIADKVKLKKLEKSMKISCSLVVSLLNLPSKFYHPFTLRTRTVELVLLYTDKSTSDF